MHISNHPIVFSPLTSISPNSPTRQIIALGITKRIVLLGKTIFQSFLNLSFNYIDKAQLQRQWRQIYTGQKEVSVSPVVQNASEMQLEFELSLSPVAQNASEMQPELADFCGLYFPDLNQKELKAVNKGLRALPESIGNLVNLKELWINCNQLQSLPESIGNLVNLKDLLLYNNQFTSIPECLFRLSTNCEIYLCYNPLSEEEIAQVRQRINQPGYRGPQIIF